MSRNLKALGLTLVAVFAMSAVVASAAQAAAWSTTGNVNATVKAEQEGTHVFEVEGSSTAVTCKKANFESMGAVASPTNTILVTPNYSECTAFGFVGATVENQGCHYHFETTSTGTKIKLICTGGAKIVITASTCQASVSGEQSFGESGTYSNVATSPETGKLEANVSGIKVKKEKDGFLCPLNGTGEVSTGTYKGNTSVKAFNEGGTQVGLHGEMP